MEYPRYPWLRQVAMPRLSRSRAGLEICGGIAPAALRHRKEVCRVTGLPCAALLDVH